MTTCFHSRRPHANGIDRSNCFPCKLELSRVDLSFPESRSTVRETTYFQTQDGRLHERVDLSRVHE